VQEAVGDDDRAGRSGEQLTEELDRLPVLGGEIVNPRHVETEGGVDDAVRVLGAAA
jgi:hypothetical protein